MVSFYSLPLVRIPLRENAKTPAIKKWQTHSKTPDLPPYVWRGNVATVCGRKSGITVVDIDVKDGGMAKWRELVAAHGTPATAYQRTPSGGLHFIFPYAPVRTTTKVGGVGIDIRNDASYIVSAPRAFTY
jgi:hypothetical protein